MSDVDDMIEDDYDPNELVRLIKPIVRIKINSILINRCG